MPKFKLYYLDQIFFDFLSQLILNSKNWVCSLLIFRWVWSFGLDGLTRLFGMLLYGTCMRYIYFQFFSTFKFLNNARKKKLDIKIKNLLGIKFIFYAQV
jgi:hypothetical protein